LLTSKRNDVTIVAVVFGLIATALFLSYIMSVGYQSLKLSIGLLIFGGIVGLTTLGVLIIRNQGLLVLLIGVFSTMNLSFFWGSSLKWEGNTELIWYFYRIQGLVSGVMLAASLIWYARNQYKVVHRKLSPLDKFVALYVSAAVLQTSVAIVMGNDPVLLIGDVFLWLYGPVVYFLFISLNDAKIMEKVWTYISYLFWFGQIFVFFLQVEKYATTGQWKVSGGIIIVLPTCYLLGKFLNRDFRNKHLFMLLASVGMVMLSLKRGPIISMFLMMIAALVFSSTVALRTKALLILLIGTPALYLTTSDFLVDEMSMISEPMEGRFRAMTGTYDSNPFNQRINEALAAFDEMARTGSFFPYIIGMGFGATFRGPKAPRTKHALLESDKIHNIHMTPAAVFFRGGVVVFLLCTFFFGYILMNTIILLKRDLWKRNIPIAVTATAASLFVIAAIIDSFKAYGLISQPMLWLCLITIRIALYSEENRKAQQANTISADAVANTMDRK